MLFVKIYEYVGFCVHRRSYLLGSPVIVQLGDVPYVGLLLRGIQVTRWAVTLWSVSSETILTLENSIQDITSAFRSLQNLIQNKKQTMLIIWLSSLRSMYTMCRSADSSGFVALRMVIIVITTATLGLVFTSSLCTRCM